MLDFDKYKNTMQMVGFSDKKQYISDRMQAVNEKRLTKVEYDEELERITLEADQWKRDTLRAYNDYNIELRRQFRHDLEVDLGIESLPKSVRDAFWNHVYEQGHAKGYQGIYNVASAIVDLILIIYIIKEGYDDSER